MAGFSLDLKVSGFADAELLIGRAQKGLDLAAARALRKAAQWLRTHSSREIARELGITQSPIRHRYKVYSTATASSVKLWVGLQPIGVNWLGAPKQNSTGVAVGHRQYDEAFIAPMKSSLPLVFIRKGRERLPVKRVMEEWADQGITALERWERRTQQRFVELFEQEARHVFSPT